MAVQIKRWTGAPASETKTNLAEGNTRANATDTHSTDGSTHPIEIPASGTNYSYWVSTRLHYDGSGTGTINNIEWFTDGSNGLGTGVGCQVAIAENYVQATGTEGETGTIITGHNDIETSADAFDQTDSGPLSVTGSTTDPTDADFGYFVVYQITVADTAGAGVAGPETFTWRWDSTIS